MRQWRRCPPGGTKDLLNCWFPAWRPFRLPPLVNPGAAAALPSVLVPDFLCTHALSAGIDALCWHLTTFYLQWKLWVLTSPRHGTLPRAGRAVFTFSLIPLVFPACRAEHLWVAVLSEHLLVICAFVVHSIGLTSVRFLVCEGHAYVTCWRGLRRLCSSINLTLNCTLTNRLH